VTDAWAGYGNVNNLNNGVYQHKVVVHAQEFVHSVHSEIHTQNIEGLWTLSVLAVDKNKKQIVVKRCDVP